MDSLKASKIKVIDQSTCPPPSLGIFLTMVSWYYNIYGTELGMSALREKLHYYVTSNLYMLPKNILYYFGANV